MSTTVLLSAKQADLLVVLGRTKYSSRHTLKSKISIEPIPSGLHVSPGVGVGVSEGVGVGEGNDVCVGEGEDVGVGDDVGLAVGD